MEQLGALLESFRVWVETIDPNKVSAASALIVAVFTGFLAKLAYTQNRETRILQRAYLTVEPDGIDQFKVKQDAPIEDLVGRIIIRNVGHLPAREVGWCSKVSFSADPKFAAFDEIPDSDYDGKNVLPPGSPMAQTTKAFPSTDLLLLNQAKTRHCFVWGRVRYKDGFGVERHTNFCHRYNCEARDGNAILAKYARYHVHGNDAD